MKIKKGRQQRAGSIVYRYRDRLCPLFVVRLNPDHSYSILSRQKQQVWPEKGEFEGEEILPGAIERLVLVWRDEAWGKRLPDADRSRHQAVLINNFF